MDKVRSTAGIHLACALALALAAACSSSADDDGAQDSTLSPPATAAPGAGTAPAQAMPPAAGTDAPADTPPPQQPMTPGDGAAGGGATEPPPGDAPPAGDMMMGPVEMPEPTPPAGASPLPTPADYGATGPFADARMFTNVGPGGNYTLFRPDASLGRDGFKHPVVAWGNGITTTPPMYEPLLTAIASHGFVIIGTNDTTVERPAMVEGLDWLIAQNDAAGELQGMLDTSKEATIGYSWGGGAAIDTADRPNVLATVSFHGMPPRGDAAFSSMHAPLLLFTSTGDTFVNRAGYVQPNYDASTVQTALAEHEGYSHITPLVVPGDAGDERAPAIAWLYLWVYGEQDARRFFYGDDCELCGGVWTDYDRKNWPQP